MRTQPTNGYTTLEPHPEGSTPAVTERDLELMFSELELLTADELSAHFKVQKDWVYRAKKRGMPFIQLDDRKLRFQISAVVRWLETRKRNYPRTA